MKLRIDRTVSLALFSVLLIISLFIGSSPLLFLSLLLFIVSAIYCTAKNTQENKLFCLSDLSKFWQIFLPMITIIASVFVILAFIGML